MYTAGSVSRVTVKPMQQQKILLGDFASVDTIKGFVIDMPDATLPDAISTQVICINTTKGVRLFMQIINYGDKSIELQIREL